MDTASDEDVSLQRLAPVDMVHLNPVDAEFTQTV